jgi:uncharacterized membrane protein
LALVSGLSFGISSWFVAMTRPTGPTDLIFQNPIVSILPRVLFAFVALGLFVWLSKLIKKEYLACVISTLVATAFHTISVVWLMYSFGKPLFTGGFIKLIMSIVVVNGWIELILAGAIVPIVVMALMKAIKVDKL